MASPPSKESSEFSIYKKRSNELEHSQSDVSSAAQNRAVAAAHIAIPPILRTSIGFRQIQKASRRGGIFHDALNFFFRQNAIGDSVVRFNDHDADTADSQKVSHLHCVGRRWVFAISQQAAGARVARKGLGRGHDPKALGVRRHEQLTRSIVGQLVALQFAANVSGVLGAQIQTHIVGIGIVVVGARSVAVAALNDHSFRFNGKGGVLLLGTGRVVARIDADFYLRIQPRINVCGHKQKRAKFRSFVHRYEGLKNVVFCRSVKRDCNEKGRNF